MDPTMARWLEHVHGHLGWLGVALLVHPALLLRRPKRRAGLAVGLATALVTVVAGLGVWVYMPYRALLKRSIFRDAPSVGWMFERKEHLAFGVLLLTWSGCAAYFGSERASPELRPKLRAMATHAFLAATLLAAVVASIGTYVAVYRSF